VAVRRNTIKRAVGPALYRVMEPGDQIIAGTWATQGAGLWVETLVVAALTALGLVIPLGADPASFLAWCAPLFLGTLVPLVSPAWRRPVFVAVTQRQLICYRLSMVNEPGRILVCAPLAFVRVTYLGRRMPLGRSIRYDVPGAQRPSLRLNVPARWLRDLDEVLAALRAQGVSVAGTPIRPAERAVLPIEPY
jgi:hypothetical protein